MSDSPRAGRVRRLTPYVNGKRVPYQPGDEQHGNWTREMLARWTPASPRGWSGRLSAGSSAGRAPPDELLLRFSELVERAFKNVTERRQSAAMNGADVSRPR
jgi:hypothetical protein